MYNDRVQYWLEHKSKGKVKIIDPIGYEDSDVEYVRNKKRHGVISNISSNIQFVKDGLEFIRDIKENFGLNEVIKMHREVRHPQTDEWETDFIGTLDLMTYSLENNQLSIKVNSGETVKTLRARESEKVEIESLESIDKIALDPLPTETLNIAGRELKLKSLLEADSYATGLLDLTFTGQLGTFSATKSVPLNVTYKSSENIHSPTQTQSISGYGNINGNTSMVFVSRTETARSLDIDLNITFTPWEVHAQANEKFKLSFVIYRGGVDYIYDREIIIREWTEAGDYHNIEFTENYEDVINLNIGESLALVFASEIELTGTATSSLLMEVRNVTADLIIKEDSTFEDTTTKMVLLHGLGKRLVQMMLGKDRFKSSILGRVSDGYTSDGEYSLIGAYCGHWARGFDALPDTEDNKYKPFATSWKDFTQSMRSVLNISTGIETINGQDYIVCEDMSYFYNPNIVIKLPNQVAKVKRSTAKDYVYSGIEIGYEKGGEYEEVFGLDEPNGKANFITNITALDNVYSQLSKYRADVYGEEIQRRKQRKLNPTEDAPFDKDIFLKDLKDDNGTLVERMYNDDFAEVSGIFSPETAKNLRLSPVRNLLRHKKDIGVALKQYPTKYLKFGSSTANSSMVTRLNGETNAIAENGDILNSSLGNPRFKPEYIEFEYDVDFEISQLLKGRSTFNGREVPNFYCKVQFINENNDREYGYIMSVKTTEGKWKLLKA